MRSILSCLLFFVAMTVTAQKYHLFIGTYTGTGSKGIYVYSFDAATGKLAPVSHTEGIESPSYLATSRDGSFLYACNETASPTGGMVSAFRFNKKEGTLTLLNQQATGGDHPAYLAVDRRNKWLIAGNYSGGSIAAFPINKDGSIKPYTQLVKHAGKSIHAMRQESAHVHATVFSPYEDYLFTPDLGMDKVMAYKFQALASQPLVPAIIPFVQTTPGSGPRHFTFHPNKKWAYLMEELSGSVTAYQFAGGQLKEMQQVMAHPETAKGPFISADIHVSPDGKFLYASNRGEENNIAIFSIEKKTGMLTPAGYQPTMGRMPRNFCIDPRGEYLLAANQETNNIVVFKRDVQTGLLTFTGEQVTIPRPVCLKMVKD
jgi:6-phosphogluconolactonase